MIFVCLFGVVHFFHGLEGLDFSVCVVVVICER